MQSLPSERAHRGTIFLETATVVDVAVHPADQFVIRLHAPKTAASARPGTFVHLTCDPELPMRRPLSILRTLPDTGAIEVLFKIVGQGLALLARREVGDEVSVLGPIGKSFELDPARPRPLLIGGGVGIPPMLFLAEAIQRDAALSERYAPFVIMGSEIPFPFELTEAVDAIPGVDPSIATTLAPLESIGVAARLTSLAGFPGCFEGYVTDLADRYLAALSGAQRDEIAVFSCGPTPMLAAVTALARRYALPCQVSLEEYMACAVGGCAGCTVRVVEDGQVAMRRVCVDGPVFDAYTVFPAPTIETAL